MANTDPSGLPVAVHVEGRFAPWSEAGCGDQSIWPAPFSVHCSDHFLKPGTDDSRDLPPGTVHDSHGWYRSVIRTKTTMPAPQKRQHHDHYQNFQQPFPVNIKHAGVLNQKAKRPCTIKNHISTVASGAFIGFLKGGNEKTGKKIRGYNCFQTPDQ